jgi:hypothetical protein
LGATEPTAWFADRLASGSKGETLGHSLNFFFRAPDLLKKCHKQPGTFFLAIDRDGLSANMRIIDPANAVWRLKVLDTAGKKRRDNHRKCNHFAVRSDDNPQDFVSSRRVLAHVRRICGSAKTARSFDLFGRGLCCCVLIRLRLRTRCPKQRQ